MPLKLVDEHYQRGRKLFQKQGTLRGMIEPILNRENDGRHDPAADAADFSAVIGFVDALLDHIRGIKR